MSRLHTPGGIITTSRFARHAIAALSAAAIAFLSVSGLAGTAAADDPVVVPVTAANVELSAPSVYPFKDSYRDSVTIRATPSTADGAPSTSAGTIEIAHGTKIVKSWAISAAAPATEKWDGRVKSKIVSGHYVVTLTYTNPDASVVTASTPLVVSAKKTVAHTWSKKVTAWGAHNSCVFEDKVSCEEWFIRIPLPPTHEGGVTHFHNKEVKGTRLTGGTGDYNPLDYESSSSVALPSAVKSSVRARMFVSGHVSLSGKAPRKFLISTCERSIGTTDAEHCGPTHTATKSGTTSSPAVTLADDTTRAAWLTTVAKHSTAIVAYYTVHVTYYTLK